MLLEQHTYNFLRNFENKEPHSDVNLNGTIYDNVEVSVPSKSKLQELKQLSVEKLAILKQKLIETKNQKLRESSSQSHGKCAMRKKMHTHTHTHVYLILYIVTAY